MTNQSTSKQSFLDSVLWHFRSWDEIKSMSMFDMANYGTIYGIIGFGAFAIFQAWRQIKKVQAANAKLASVPAQGFPEIEPQPDFDWKATEPAKIHPFKPKYHLTMAPFSDDTALESLNPSELILMDSQYQDRIKYRRDIIKDASKRPEVLNIDPRSRDHILGAVAELYTYLFTHYLPIRYPTMFRIHHTTFEYGPEIMAENRVTGELFSARAIGGDDRPLTIERMLEAIGRHVDEDFLFLLPESRLKEPVEKDRNKKPKIIGLASDPKPEKKEARKKMVDSKPEEKPVASATSPLEEDTSPYILAAYMTVCPNGFLPSQKLGKPLREIHGPVPGYEDKLAGSMDRFFSKIEVGKYVKRANWSVTVGADLFAAPLGGVKTHAYKGEEVEELSELDVDNTYLRVERQTLHRLPTSKALVFAFHTYLYPLSEIRSDPRARDSLIEAIDGLGKGNVPDMEFYKRGKVWGGAVRKYLSS